MIVYKIQNLLDGKVYIGQTVRRLNKRMTAHMRANTYIGNALRLHGLAAFVISVVYTAMSQEELDEKEKEYIKSYDCKWPSGYNLTDGGEGGDAISNHPRNKEIRAAISEAAKRPCREETKRKISRSLMGHPVSEEMRRKSSELNRQYRHTEDAKRKITESQLGEKHWLYGKHHSEETRRKISETTKAKMREIRIQRELNKREVKRHESSDVGSLPLQFAGA